MLYVYHQVYKPSLSPDGKIVTLVHYGEYKYLSEAYSALTRFIKDNLLVANTEISTEYARNEENTNHKDNYVTILTAGVHKCISNTAVAYA